MAPGQFLGSVYFKCVCFLYKIIVFFFKKNVNICLHFCKYLSWKYWWAELKYCKLTNKQRSMEQNKIQNYLPAVHCNGMVSCLLLLLLDSCNEVNHSLPFSRNSNFRPSMKMKLSDKSAQLLLVIQKQENHKFNAASRVEWNTGSQPHTLLSIGTFSYIVNVN